MSWSLDSARLAYDVSGTAQTQFGVAVVPAAGGPVARLVEGLGRPGRPDWSPLGALAFSDGDVRTIDADGTAPSRLVAGGPGIQSDPRWSPAGDRIGFVTESERSSFPEVGSYLEVADPDGGGRIRITPESPPAVQRVVPAASIAPPERLGIASVQVHPVAVRRGGTLTARLVVESVLTRNLVDGAGISVFGPPRRSSER